MHGRLEGVRGSVVVREGGGTRNPFIAWQVREVPRHTSAAGGAAGAAAVNVGQLWGHLAPEV